MVKNGENAIGALLAPGWYETPLEWFQQPNNYGDTPPALRAQLRIEHTDGSVEWVTTDAEWQARAVVHRASRSSMTAKRRMRGWQQRGWDTAGFPAERMERAHRRSSPQQ